MKDLCKKRRNIIIFSIIIFTAGMFCCRYFNLTGIEMILESYDGIIDGINVLLVGASLVSILLLYRQIKGEHEKSRREKAIELLLEWTKGVSRETNAAKKIVEKFDTNQCRKLFLQEEDLKVSCKQYREIVGLFGSRQEKEKTCEACKNDKTKEKIRASEEVAEEDVTGNCDQLYSLSTDQIKRLRWHVISYLNLLEAILVSWQYSVAEREIIEQQFAFMVSPKEGRNVLEAFRIAAGSEDSYPAIEIFCNHMETERKKKLKEKGNIF